MRYIPSIGIECHVQLNTHTKLFAAVGNDARAAQPNTLISPICMGLPGTLPVLNQAAIDKAVRFAFAVNSRPQKHSIFERKHYFYPDLPKGYQITQFHEPIVKGGYVEIEINNKSKKIRLNRVQLEEDAGKNIHPEGKYYSLVDLNRAGTPLLEIVSEPDISSAEEAKAYAHELYLLVRYADVGDGDLYHGNMRFDVNVSISKSPTKLGTRTETKNLNSFRSVFNAVEYEIKRQIEILERGQEVVQETRGWDEAKQKTFSQRGKEEAHDYRYMPEPDIPPLELDEGYVRDIEASMPILPSEWRSRLKELKLDSSYIETLLEAEVEDERFSYLPLIEENLKNKEHAKFLANCFINIEIPMRRKGKVDQDLKDVVRAEMYEKVYSLLKNGKLNSTSAKGLISNLLEQGIKPENIRKYAEEQGYIQVSDKDEITKFVEEVIKDNPQAVTNIKAGEIKAIDFLIGQVMKKSLGKANPKTVQKILKDKLIKN